MELIARNPFSKLRSRGRANRRRPMTDEERGILQGMVNSFYDQFVHVVVEGRHLPEATSQVRGFLQSASRLQGKAQAWSLGPKPSGGVVTKSWHT